MFVLWKQNLYKKSLINHHRGHANNTLKIQITSLSSNACNLCFSILLLTFLDSLCLSLSSLSFNLIFSSNQSSIMSWNTWLEKPTVLNECGLRSMRDTPALSQWGYVSWWGTSPLRPGAAPGKGIPGWCLVVHSEIGWRDPGQWPSRHPYCCSSPRTHTTPENK